MKKVWLTGATLAAGLLLSTTAFAQIKIGIGAPITGPSAASGAQIKQGTELAIKNINAAGGVLGQKLESEVGDDQSDPKQGVSVANKFVGDGVTWVVGHYNSGVTIPASEVYSDNGIVAITPAATNEKVTDRKLWDMFRTCGRDDQQAKVWVDYVKAKYPGKKIAIVHDKTTYGQGLGENAKKLMAADGMKEVLFEGVNTGEKDYSAIVTKLKAAGADVLIYGGLYTEAALILKQLRDQGMQTVMVSGDGLVSSEFATIGGDAVIGTQMSFAPKAEDDPANAAIVKQFKDAGFTPEGYTLKAYAAVQVLAQAAAEAKSADPQKMAEVMHSGKAFKTVIGDVAYDEKGDMKQIDYVIFSWKKGPDGKIDFFQNK
ncbi:branched-chain amino acid ABC transporter substrate-binding protein [Labrys neptuniae]